MKSNIGLILAFDSKLVEVENFLEAHKDDQIFFICLSALPNEFTKFAITRLSLAFLNQTDNFNITSENYSMIKELFERINEICQKIVVLTESQILHNIIFEQIGRDISFGSILEFNNNLIDYPNAKTKEILSSLNKIKHPLVLHFHGARFFVLPGVYPSNRFRSSNELANFTAANIVADMRVADIGCGHGTMGLLSLLHGAEHCDFIDINPVAILSVKETLLSYSQFFSKSTIINGDVFSIQKLISKYDIIFFNPPFHLEKADSTSHIQHSLRIEQKGKNVIGRFFANIRKFTHSKSVIYLAFSNKDPKALRYLLKTIKNNNFECRLVVHKFENTKADVRIYKITQ